MDEDTRQELNHANAAIEYAQEVRAYHRRRTRRGNKQREDDISLALDRLKRAMQPIRTRIGKMPYTPAVPENELVRQVSKDIQIERRKLWKMRKEPLHGGN